MAYIKNNGSIRWRAAADLHWDLRGGPHDRVHHVDHGSALQLLNHKERKQGEQQN